MANDFTARGMTMTQRRDLASASTGKGAALVGVEGGGTIADTLPPAQKHTPTATGSVSIFVKDILEKYLFPEQFGATGNGISDDTAAWQDAINAASMLKKPIMFPSGTCVADGLALANRVQIRGMGRAQSLFKAKAGSANPMFKLPMGQVQGFALRDVDFQGLGAQNAGQPCWSFTSQMDAGGNGGMWTCNFENIEIRGFDGDSIAFRGGHDNFIRPHQWVTLSKIQVERPRKESGYALYMSGQCEAFTFNTCRFDGNGSGTYVAGASDQGINVYLGREFGGTSAALGDNAPDMIKFINGVCQQATVGMVIDRCENIDIDTCRFEDLGNAIRVGSSAIARIHGCRFGDAANVVSSGTALSVTGDARVVFGPGNRFLGVTTKSVTTDGAGSVYMSGPTWGGLGAEANVIPTRTVSAGSTQLLMRSARGVYLSANAEGIILNNLASDLSPGEDFFIQMNPGSNTVTLSNSGGSYPNTINLGAGIQSLPMLGGETHYFQRSNVTRGWNYKGKT
ncbi:MULTISPECIES: glycosyl hydrolase family 28-related protein [unclassified Novosphingobium]|uniref:glycosyl hydrolase family 28-related protein n=1 Tax=unclassified Novosphingobium TaxID=2644732 RepID=UPI00135C0086|nr:MULTISPECIES: glycosyl hydrolase family 28-related protein [unclassified Novosphingobium]